MSEVQDEIGRLVTRGRETMKRRHLLPRHAAVNVIRKASPGAIRALATERLIDLMTKEEREATLAAERAAERQRLLAENFGSGGGRTVPRRGSRAYAAWATETAEGQRYEKERQQTEEEAEDRRWERLGAALDRFTADLRLEWTAELLNSTFTLPNGEAVTWGAATVEQHVERRDMFLRNAEGNLEGAARHDLAVRELRQSAAATLNELVAAGSRA